MHLDNMYCLFCCSVEERGNSCFSDHRSWLAGGNTEYPTISVSHLYLTAFNLPKQMTL
jgi:hypothetical protein